MAIFHTQMLTVKTLPGFWLVNGELQLGQLLCLSMMSDKLFGVSMGEQGYFIHYSNTQDVIANKLSDCSFI